MDLFILFYGYRGINVILLFRITNNYIKRIFLFYLNNITRINNTINH